MLLGLKHVLILVMDNGLVLFTSDRGIAPAKAAKLADDHGFTTFYVPEHTHIPIKREAAHPTTGDESLPDDRYMRTLDPWVSLGTACAVTSRVRLSTAVALPVEHDPITLAKSIATLDHLSGGRVSLGVGFGWNTDELADHNVPPGRRRTMLREYLEAMRALWTEEEASYEGEFVNFGPSWAWPKPVQSHIPVRVSCQTMALWYGRPVWRFHTSVVSRWFVMPSAARSPATRLVRFSAVMIAAAVRSQISTGLCSTHPALGKICSCSSWWRPTSVPA